MEINFQFLAPFNTFQHQRASNSVSVCILNCYQKCQTVKALYISFSPRSYFPSTNINNITNYKILIKNSEKYTDFHAMYFVMFIDRYINSSPLYGVFILNKLLLLFDGIGPVYHSISIEKVIILPTIPNAQTFSGPILNA